MRLNRIDLITLTLAVAVPVGAYFGYFRQSVNRLQALRAEESSLAEQTADDHRTTRDVSVVRADLRSLEEHVAEFMASVTTQDEASRAVDEVLRSAKEAGISIEQIRPGAAVGGRVLGYLPITLTASGGFPKFYAFLSAIERGKTVMTVGAMELESDAASSNCAIRLELRVYFGKGEPNAAEGRAT